MAVKKKQSIRLQEEVKKTIEEYFGNRIVTISSGDSPNQWVASHSAMEVKVVVRRLNPDIINNIYDIAYKIMSKNKFEYLISLRIVGHSEEENTLRAHKIIKGKLLSDIGIYREAGIWKAV